MDRRDDVLDLRDVLFTVSADQHAVEGDPLDRTLQRIGTAYCSRNPRTDSSPVDLLALGANDLTAELGIAGQYDHPLVRDAVATVAEACATHGKLFMLGGISDPGLYASLAQLRRLPADPHRDGQGPQGPDSADQLFFDH